jgi:nitrogen fixation/metabolism regulation signal transduction histidine kinase
MMRLLAKPFLIGLVVVLALILLLLLAFASANTSFFDQYFALLFAANVLIGVLFLLVIVALVFNLAMRLRQKYFGSRLIAKLAMFFALVGVLPGAILYGVSLQFVSRSIESWFDVKVERALEAGLQLGRTSIEISRTELLSKGREIAGQIQATSRASGEGALTLLLSRQREQNSLEEITLFGLGSKVVASAGLSLNSAVSEMSQADKLQQAKSVGYFTQIDEPNSDLSKKTYTIKLLIPIDGLAGGSLGGFNLRSQSEDRYLLLVRNMPESLSNNALAVQSAYIEYQEKALGRSGLRKMYIGTLTITLFLALFIAMALALLLGRQLATPLIMLLKGTKAVAEGDLSPKPELNTGDELGLLTKQFNVMTRQLLEARNLLEDSKTFSESVLSNLTAGVCVLDKDFKLVVSNAGASRIFGTPLDELIGKSLGGIPRLQEFEAAIKDAFSVHEISSNEDSDHWQKQIILDGSSHIDSQHEHGITLLVRGTHLPSGLFIVVFDDISEVITAQRSIAWGDVARRLAHEIKNPLTPIQLSAERIQLKLKDHLDAQQQDFLERSTTTIITQVEAMKQMVNDFRDFAKTPEAQLQELSINSLVIDVLGLYGGTPVRADLDQACPMIMADAMQIRQVIHNLIQNGLDASVEANKGEFSILVKTEFLPYPDSNDADKVGKGIVKLSILDAGTGFAPRILSRAFEPYVTTKAKGTGLGLATVKKIVDEHGARIELRNRMEDNQVIGAEVSIYFNQLVKQS